MKQKNIKCGGPDYFPEKDPHIKTCAASHVSYPESFLHNCKYSYGFTAIRQTAGRFLVLMLSFILVNVLLCNLYFNYFRPAGLKPLYAETLEEQLERVKKERENTQKEIEKAKKAEAEYTAQVNQVESNLINSLGELEDLNMQLSESKTEVDRLTIELVIKKKELKDVENILRQQTELLNERVAIIYKNRSRDLMELLMEPNSFVDFFSKLKLMNMIAQQDMEILLDVQETKGEIGFIKENIEDLKTREKRQKLDLEELVGESETKTREIEGIYNEKKSLLSRTRANKEALIKMEEELAAKEKEITRKLEALRYGTAPGKLLYPLNGGVLTSGFGNRISPITGTLRFHSGIDLGANPGNKVLAAAQGEVINAEYIGGYGYTVIIYHGGGFSTLYAHLSGFAVSSGQTVKQGQIIGYVGSTGFATGPHLHFEVRVNGAARNPYGYF
jgi:murein DD-endopeptidase MepM/ murein hydrolase activator NlpD